jgi:hypothetical protein
MLTLLHVLLFFHPPDSVKIATCLNIAGIYLCGCGGSEDMSWSNYILIVTSTSTDFSVWKRFFLTDSSVRGLQE